MVKLNCNFEPSNTLKRSNGLSMFHNRVIIVLMYLAMIDSPEGRSKFEIIYYKYRDLMFFAAHKILSDSCDAEDVVHEAFLKIVDIIDKIKDVDSPQTRALVVIITEHKAIDLYRKKQREKVIPFEEEYMGGRHHAEVERVADDQIVVNAIEMLPQKYKEVLLLKYSHGYSMDEIAVMLSMTKENVKKTIQRARNKLEQLLHEEEARQ